MLIYFGFRRLVANCQQLYLGLASEKQPTVSLDWHLTGKLSIVQHGFSIQDVLLFKAFVCSYGF